MASMDKHQHLQPSIRAVPRNHHIRRLLRKWKLKKVVICHRLQKIEITDFNRFEVEFTLLTFYIINIDSNPTKIHTHTKCQEMLINCGLPLIVFFFLLVTTKLNTKIVRIINYTRRRTLESSKIFSHDVPKMKISVLK